MKSLLFVLTLAATTCQAQNAAPSNQSGLPQSTIVPSSPPDPAITQIRKSVTFIKLRCLGSGQEFDVRGTGFFVFYPDPRLGENRGFVYLVTNRHVAMCWNDEGHSMQVESISITLNRRRADSDTFAEDGFLNQYGNVPWVLPQDDSIDLAVLPFAPDEALFDYKTLAVSMLTSRDLLQQRRIAEGEPVFFAGFFYQFPGAKRMEPIVRQGIIAMMPTDKVPFVGMAERVYLADLHAFGGNSGSPAFINLAGYRDGSMTLGQDYRLLGVVNGEVTEDENFNLELTNTLKGSAKANSGISTIVPADEVRALLDDPRLQRVRDDAVKAAAAAEKR